MSPLGAYAADVDMVLLLDVARYKYPPHWVPAAALFDAMRRPAGNASRGWVVVTVPPDGGALPAGGPPPLPPEPNFAGMLRCVGGGGAGGGISDPNLIQLCIATGGAGLAVGVGKDSGVGGKNSSGKPCDDGGGGGGLAWTLVAAFGVSTAGLTYELLRRERLAVTAVARAPAGLGMPKLLQESEA